MDNVATGTRIQRAYVAAGMSQRDLARETGLSQATLSRIISGHRTPKTPEVLAIASATGHTVAELTGTSNLADRVQCAARATKSAGMATLRRELLHFMELDAYLDDQAIPATT